MKATDLIKEADRLIHENFVCNHNCRDKATTLVVDMDSKKKPDPEDDRLNAPDMHCFVCNKAFRLFIDPSFKGQWVAMLDSEFKKKFPYHDK